MNWIPHNYVIPQAMPHAIPQTHSSFYPNREKMRSSIYNEVDWFTNERLSNTIGTIGLP